MARISSAEAYTSIITILILQPYFLQAFIDAFNAEPEADHDEESVDKVS